MRYNQSKSTSYLLISNFLPFFSSNFNFRTIKYSAEAWIDHLQSIKLKVDDTTMTIQSERLNTMEPISEIDETTLDDLSTPSTADRDQGDLIKVKKVCKCS